MRALVCQISRHVMPQSSIEGPKLASVQFIGFPSSQHTSTHPFVCFFTGASALSLEQYTLWSLERKMQLPLVPPQLMSLDAAPNNNGIHTALLNNGMLEAGLVKVRRLTYNCMLMHLL